MGQIYRVGNGYDVHRLEEGIPLIIGGVEIPFEKGLQGHSDADVLVHAIMDALLGASSMPDIGVLFPDNDERYKGISSIILLKKVIAILKEKSFTVINTDSVIIAERPKLSPFIPEMRSVLAEALQVNAEDVGVKATTTEGLGFTGEGRGIAAQAVVLLVRG